MVLRCKSLCVMKSKFEKFSWLLLIVIFLVGFWLRVRYLPQGVLTFGYDQARDAVHAVSISKGDLKILGPSASTPGLYHGVFYYYLLAPAYALGHGNPVVVAYWIAFLNSLTVFIVFCLTLLMTKKTSAGLFSAFLFAISFEATQYATWLSNPTIAVWTVPLMYLGLWLWTKTSKKYLGPVLTAVGLGMSIQAEIFLAYHLVPVFIWLGVNKKVVTKKQLLVALGVLGVSLSTLIVSEIKFGFKGLGGVRLLLSGGESNLAYAKSLGDYFTLYLNQIGRIFAFNSYPGNIGYGGALVIVLALYFLFGRATKKESWPLLLALWLFSHLTVVTVGGTSTPFLMVGIGPAVSVVLGIFLWQLFDNNKRVIALVILGLLVWGNLNFIFKENSRGATLFAIQKDMLLAKELKLVEYTYQASSGKEFTVNSLTSPLWMNIVWSYLYQWYGQKTYGYAPYFTGHDQVGQITALPQRPKILDNHFLILEPMGGIPTRYLEETVSAENVRSVLKDTQSWGELTVEKRQPINSN